MYEFQMHQRFWDVLNCREIEVIDSNGVDYWCKIIYPNLIECSVAGKFYVSWFTKGELEKFQPLN